MTRSTAAQWPPLAPLVAWEARLARRAQTSTGTRLLYEFIRFGVKQAWACLFGGILVGLMLATNAFYPPHAALARYDFLFLAALAVQALLLALKAESWREAGVIAIFHIVGTAMEVFKTAVGSWIYPGDAFFRIGGVPLFTGFMYAAIGSYMMRAWTLFDFRFTHHPPRWTVGLLAVAIYVNFFAHHYVPDIRWALFAATAALFWRCRIFYRVHHSWRWMPLLLAAFLAASFIWLAENVGTVTRTWLYPSQMAQWSPVGLGKLGSWFLLQIVSYALILVVRRPEPPDDAPIRASQARHDARLGRA